MLASSRFLSTAPLRSGCLPPGEQKYGRANVRNVVRLLRKNPLLAADVPVHGLMFDPASGRIEPLANGYASEFSAR